ncbi:MAG: NTP transferase domain-containing protein [Polyangiaceae bacterium]
MNVLTGIFVGGRGTRMGTVAKGLLPAPGGRITLLARLLGEIGAALPGAEIVLVGEHPAYEPTPLLMLPDARPGAGPLAGLVSLFDAARERGVSHVLAFASDLPFVTRDSVSRLVSEAPEAAVLLPERDGHREPLIARYDVAACYDVARAQLDASALSLQGLLDKLGESVVHIGLPRSELVDWDAPDDPSQVQ